MLAVTAHTQGVTHSGKERVLQDMLEACPRSIAPHVAVHTVVPARTGPCLNVVYQRPVRIPNNYVVDEFIVQTRARHAKALLLPYGTQAVRSFPRTTKKAVILYDRFFGAPSAGLTFRAKAGSLYRPGAVRRALKGAYCVLSTDPVLVEELALTQRACLFSPGVDSAIFAPRGPSGEEARGGILIFGGTSERKNLSAQMEAARRAAVAYDVGVTLIGESPSGIPADIRLKKIRWVDDETLAGLYRDACVVVLCPKSEGYGLPVLEAIACGSRVVATMTPSLSTLHLRLGVDAIPGVTIALSPTVDDIVAAILAAMEQPPVGTNERVQRDIRRERRAADFWEKLTAMDVV